MPTPSLLRRAKRIQFILKFRDSYGHTDESSFTGFKDPLSSGLKNSVAFVADMLRNNGFIVEVVHVHDANGIDAAVTAFRPNVAIIEAFWVPPYKFRQLKPLHPHVHWIVRNHSEIPFLSMEGIAMGWIKEYLRDGIEVNSNTERAAHDIAIVANAIPIYNARVSFLPNFYPTKFIPPSRVVQPSEVNIGCFGAIRPLKNQLLQAISALEFAQTARQFLRFHINFPRIEGAADRILKNLRELFKDLYNAELVEHMWLHHHEFIKLMRHMDINMQVSFSETFNIVTADAVDNNVPVVGSREVMWLPEISFADSNSSESMTHKLLEIWHDTPADREARLAKQRLGLTSYCDKSKEMWTTYLNNI